jgi:D-inositol-3-phosphate glycosyltransferase
VTDTLAVGVRWDNEFLSWLPTGRCEAIGNVLARLQAQQGLRLGFFQPPGARAAAPEAPKELALLSLPLRERSNRQWDLWYSPHTDASNVSLLQLRNAVDHRLPVVLSLHGLPLLAEHFCGGALVSGLIGPHDAVVVTSRRAQRILQALLESAGERAPHLELIPWGIDDRLLEPLPPRAEARERLGIPLDRVVCLSFGRISPTIKADIIPLLSTIARHGAQLRSAGFLLYLAGYFRESWYEERVRREIGSSRIEDLVMLAGPVGRDDRALVCAAADFAVNLSDVVFENQHLVACECLAAGLPQIASDWDGLADAVEHGVTGYLIETTWDDVASDILPLLTGRTALEQGHMLGQSVSLDLQALGSRLVELTLDQGLRGRMSLASRSRASRYRWSAVADRYEGLFRDRAGRARAAAPPPAAPLAHLQWQASRRLDPEAVATLQPAGRELHEGVRTLDVADYLEAIYPEEVIGRVLELFAERERLSLAQILAGGIDDRGSATRVFLFLLKHGYTAW